MEYENLVLSEKVTSNYYVEQEIVEKVGKYPINIGWMIIFHVHNGNKIFKDLI